MTSVDTASEALAISMSEKASVDLEYMAELTGKTKEAVIEELRGVIFRSDIEMYRSKKTADKDAFAMTIGNKLYTDKKEAAIALMETCVHIKTFQVEKKVGEYLGFRLEASFDYFNNRIVMDIAGYDSHKIEIGMDSIGNITRINNALEGMPKRLDNMQTVLDNTKRQLENTRIEV